MKYKKLMIVGLVLLAILTIGAVSASEDVNSTDTLTVETMEEVSVDASDEEIVSLDDEQILESSDAEVQAIDNFTSMVPELEVSVSDVEYGEPAVANITVVRGPGEGNLLVNLDDERNYTVSFIDYAASCTFEDLDVGTHTITVTYETQGIWNSATATTSFEVFEKVEPDSYFDVNSDLITFREVVTLLHYKVGDNATGVLTVRNKDIPAWVFFRKSISEMEYNYQMKGYKFDQYDGYVVFKEDLENATTGQYNLEIFYEEDGNVIDSVETTVYLDFKSESINGETDKNKDEDIIRIHIPESYNNGALVLTWGNILYADESGDPELIYSKVINITVDMLGQTLTFKRSDLDLSEEGDYNLDARYVSYDEFEFIYLDPDDEWPEDTYQMGIVDDKVLYLKYIGDEDGHYAIYWKTRYLYDSDYVIVVDNTKFRVKVESTSLLDKNGKLMVYCPEGTADQTIKIEANDKTMNYYISEDGKYAEFDLSYFEFVDVGNYTFKIYDGDNNLILDYDYTFENPLEIPDKAIIGTNDFMSSTVVYLVVPDGTNGILTISDENGDVLFRGYVDQLDVLTEKEQIDNQFYGEEGILNRYYVLDSKLNRTFEQGTYNLTAEFQEIINDGSNSTMPQQSTARFSKTGEIRLVERKYVESDGASIELFDYDEHRFCDEEDWIAVIHAQFFNESGTVLDPSQDDVIIDVSLVDEEGNEKIYNFQLEDDDGEMACVVWIDDDELAPGDYVVTVTYYYNGRDGNFLSLSSNMTFVGDEEDPVSKTTLFAEDLEMHYRDGSAWTVTLTDYYGEAMSNAIVKVGIKGAFYYLRTNADGVASLPINLAAGTYEVNASFEGDESHDDSFVSSTITVLNPAAILSADDLYMCYKDGSEWAATLTDHTGNPIVNTIVKVGINGKTYNIKTDANGTVKLTINLLVGVYEVNATFEGNNRYSSAFIASNVYVNKPTVTNLLANDLEMCYKDGSAWTVTLTNASGSPIVNSVVKVGIKGKYYTMRTNTNGEVSLPINLAVGTYEINATFEGNEAYDSSFVSSTIAVKNPAAVLTGEDVEMDYGDSGDYAVTLTDPSGNAIVNNYVRFTINGATYNRQTNDEGIATLPINLLPGTYSISASFNGNYKFSAVEITNTIVVRP